ncbi:phage tail tip lysozyme [Micromonospora sp. IBHARD004]|uniref:phage tail tip lysozyme n=1 Tax=Micromonospora sp. IBHARD004 TaxID=3457764 RepID=UPI0040598445
MRIAGAGPAFAYSRAHQTYIRAARRNRLGGVTGNPFWAYRADEIVPRIGDLVCASRSGSGATYDNIGDGQYRPTHCDVVSEIGSGGIWVIGGNVDQTVGRKWLTTLPDGRLSLAGKQSRFFAVISCGGQRPVLTPTRGAPSSPPAAPAPAGVEGRAVRVMELLVRRYGYPVNGAAGLVGNLIAESGVIPERIEGSAEGTPMRAADFSGRVRTFTPDEIRDRDYTRRLGPKLPGVGIAQWTSRNRRAGLFSHSLQGRRPGSAILSDLDAQVDYLVTELRRDYGQVDATLRSPGITVDRASDVVLLRFERPAVVVNGQPGDPAVQQALARRRAHGARALAAYRRAHP